MNEEKLVGDVPTLDERTLVRLERADTIWAYVAEYPAEKTEAGSNVPPSETLIRITSAKPIVKNADPRNPSHWKEDTATLVSALEDELPAHRELAALFSKHTGLTVRLRRFTEVIDEELIQDGRVKSLNVLVVPNRKEVIV